LGVSGLVGDHLKTWKFEHLRRHSYFFLPSPSRWVLGGLAERRECWVNLDRVLPSNHRSPSSDPAADTISSQHWLLNLLP
jgi:hypothetical protein